MPNYNAQLARMKRQRAELDADIADMEAAAAREEKRLSKRSDVPLDSVLAARKWLKSAKSVAIASAIEREAYIVHDAEIGVSVPMEDIAVSSLPECAFLAAARRTGYDINGRSVIVVDGEEEVVPTSWLVHANLADEVASWGNWRGVNPQLVLMDEVLKGREHLLSERDIIYNDDTQAIVRWCHNAPEWWKDTGGLKRMVALIRAIRKVNSGDLWPPVPVEKPKPAPKPKASPGLPSATGD